tara:strand:- start:437 stop:676 length:240 start_codon:yes stop_codon:yes gene_type:complete
METELQILEHRLKIIQSKKITMIPYYCEDSKRRDLEHCRKAIERVKNSVKDYYDYDEDCNNDYHQEYLDITGKQRTIKD